MMINIYEAIKEKGTQIAIFQAKISGLQAEIQALRAAARILQGGGAIAEAARPVSVAGSVAAGADKSKQRGWP